MVLTLILCMHMCVCVCVYIFIYVFTYMCAGIYQCVHEEVKGKLEGAIFPLPPWDQESNSAQQLSHFRSPLTDF